jgi:hypothetical protein
MRPFFINQQVQGSATTAREMVRCRPRLRSDSAVCGRVMKALMGFGDALFQGALFYGVFQLSFVSRHSLWRFSWQTTSSISKSCALELESCLRSIPTSARRQEV